MNTSQEGFNDIVTQIGDDCSRDEYELDRSNLGAIFERMAERGMTYQKLKMTTAKKGDALFSSIAKGKILDFESLKNLIDPKRIRYVYLNGSGKRISIFVEHQTAPYFGAVVVGGIWKLVVKTTKGWEQTEVSL